MRCARAPLFRPACFPGRPFLYTTMRCEPLRPTEKPVQRWHGPGQRQQPERTPASGSGFLHSPGAGNVTAPKNLPQHACGKAGRSGNVQGTGRPRTGILPGCLAPCQRRSGTPGSGWTFHLHDPAGQFSCTKRPVSSTPCRGRDRAPFCLLSSVLSCSPCHSLTVPADVQG